MASSEQLPAVTEGEPLLYQLFTSYCTKCSCSPCFPDEAALYDRQIRLWGLEAQNRIRKAHILVINLDGLTTEAIKNWVLAGISALTVVDYREETSWHDLSAGFFWREEDVGKERLPPAAARIQALNPLVKVSILSSQEALSVMDPSSSKLASLGANVVVAGVPSGPQGLSRLWQRDSLIKLNDVCRSLSIPFYCAGTLGLNGWIFSDLGEVHEYVIEKPDFTAPVPPSTNPAAGDESDAAKDDGAAQANNAKKLEKRQQEFVSLGTALETTWKGLSRAQQRRNRLSAGLFGVWAIWDLMEGQENEEASRPEASKLLEKALQIMQKRGVDSKMVFESQGVDSKAFFTSLETSITTPGEFSPTCAILGGVLSQDVLNALGGREEPLVNWFQLEGSTGETTLHCVYERCDGADYHSFLSRIRPDSRLGHIT